MPFLIAGLFFFLTVWITSRARFEKTQDTDFYDLDGAASKRWTLSLASTSPDRSCALLPSFRLDPLEVSLAASSPIYYPLPPPPRRSRSSPSHSRSRSISSHPSVSFLPLPPPSRPPSSVSAQHKKTHSRRWSTGKELIQPLVEISEEEESDPDDLGPLSSSLLAARRVTF